MVDTAGAADGTASAAETADSTAAIPVSAPSGTATVADSPASTPVNTATVADGPAASPVSTATAVAEPAVAASNPAPFVAGPGTAVSGPAERRIGGVGVSGTIQSIAAGAVATLVGAILWAVIVEVSGYKVGFAAIGIGFLVGQAMAVTAGTSRSLPPIGAVLALAGCLLGDAFVDAHEVAKQFGVSTSFVLHRMISDPNLAVDIFKVGFEAFDLVFWAIAAFQGYKLTARAVERHRPATAR